jgi:hypothetical protein
VHDGECGGCLSVSVTCNCVPTTTVTFLAFPYIVLMSDCSILRQVTSALVQVVSLFDGIDTACGYDV